MHLDDTQNLQNYSSESYFFTTEKMKNSNKYLNESRIGKCIYMIANFNKPHDENLLGELFQHVYIYSLRFEDFYGNFLTTICTFIPEKKIMSLTAMHPPQRKNNFMYITYRSPNAPEAILFPNLNWRGSISQTSISSVGIFTYSDTDGFPLS